MRCEIERCGIEAAGRISRSLRENPTQPLSRRERGLSRTERGILGEGIERETCRDPSIHRYARISRTGPETPAELGAVKKTPRPAFPTSYGEAVFSRFRRH